MVASVAIYPDIVWGRRFDSASRLVSSPGPFLHTSKRVHLVHCRFHSRAVRRRPLPATQTTSVHPAQRRLVLRVAADVGLRQEHRCLLRT